MINDNATIKNVKGIHARPSSYIAHAMQDFQSHLVLYHQGKSGNPKSALDLMFLHMSENDCIFISADGVDEGPALIYLKFLLEMHFGPDEIGY